MNFDAQSDLITVNSVKLQTSGGTPTSLNYYEEYSGTATFNNGINSTVVNVHCTRIGNIKCVQIEGPLNTASGNGQTIDAAAASIPTRFCPSAFINIYASGYDATSGNIPIVASLMADGSVSVGTPGFGGFGTTGTQGANQQLIFTFVN